jgi:hypothetical protein
LPLVQETKGFRTIKRKYIKNKNKKEGRDVERRLRKKERRKERDK